MSARDWDNPDLVEPTGDDSASRDNVEDRKDTNLDHQLLQLVYLGPATLLFYHCPVICSRKKGRRRRTDRILKSEMNPAARKETPRRR